MPRQGRWLVLGWGVLALVGLPASGELQVGEAQLKEANPVVVLPNHIVPGRAKPAAPAKEPSPVVKTEVIPRTDDIMDFLNGDRLRGDLVALNLAEEQLLWRHKGVKEPITFQLTGVAHVDLLPRKASALAAHSNVVQLINGDQLRGDLVTLDAEKLVLNTWYAGSLVVRRDQLALIQPSSKPSATLYEGPTDDLAGWVAPAFMGGTSHLGWTCHRGMLTPGEGRSLGRHIPNMPDQVQIEFEVAVHKSKSFSFSFFLQDPQNGGGDNDAYMLKFFGDNVQLSRIVHNEGSQDLGSVQLGDRHAERKREMITLLADRKERRFALLLDGRLLREWKDSREFKGQGDAIMFLTHQRGALQIAKIKVSRWDGTLPRLSGGDSPVATTIADRLECINGDALTGKVRAIAKSIVKFETSYAMLDVPLERAINIRFAAAKPAATSTNLAPGEVRAWFSRTEPLTLKLTKLQNGELSGVNLGCGPMRIPLSAFLLLEFNLGAKRPDPDFDL